MSNIQTDSPEPFPERAALLFLSGQYALRYRDERDGLMIKLLAPEAVRSAFSRIPVDSGWLPPEVRRWGHSAHGEYAVMFVPAQKHLLRLTNTFGERFPGKRIVKIEVPLPAMVFAGLGNAYAVWACAEAPHPDAVGYQTPLPNVGGGAGICFGDNHPPRAKPESIALAWKLFMSTPFNNHLIGGSSKAHPKDVREQLLALADSHADAYPVSDLVSCKHTIEEGIRRLLADRGGAA